MIKFPKYWIYYILLINLLLTLPMFVYSNDAMRHWLFHLMALSASKLFLPVLLIYLLWHNCIGLKEFFKHYSGLFFFAILCFLFFPTYIGDLKFIDKYDWFTVPAKVIIWVIAAGLTLTNLIFSKDE